MRGRKPKPALLKDLHGSKEPRNPDEPIAVGDLSVDPAYRCPEHFTSEQGDAWEYALRHSPPGLLKYIDASVLEAWVVAHCLHRRATREMLGRGLLIKQGSLLMPSPLIGIINRQAIIMMKAASELGFSPVSRPRIFAAGPAIGESLSSRPTQRAKDAPQQSLQDYLDNAPRPAALN